MVMMGIDDKLAGAVRAACIGLVLAGPPAYAEAPVAGEPVEAAGKALPLAELRAFAEVFGRIKDDYVEPVDDARLLRYAIEGMLNGLDPHSAYLGEEDFRDLRVGTSGEFGGLGIEIGEEDGFIKVISPIDDTPAQRAGVEAGDLIIRIDDKPIKDLTLDEAVKLMRGKPGSEIKLTVIRGKRDKPLDIVIVRDIIKTVSVRSRMLEPGYGYIRISQFQSRTAEDMLKAISGMKKEEGGTLRGLVLDLRNNPGGILNSAVAISDAFLTEGTIVYTEGRVRDSQLKFKAAPDDVVEGAPVVVLVNAGSASASEIVAGALQDHKRAVIMGSKTFGKGSVQTIVPVNETTAIKLTTARYFTPSGRSIQAEGIVPDIQLQNIRLTRGEERPALVTEADLSGHLENPNGSDKSGDGKGGHHGGTPGTGPGAGEDYALNEALNLLKGLNILAPPRG